MASSDFKLEKGNVFGGYRITERLGPGVMGIVYLARDTREVRRIALKILQPELTLDKEYVKLFEEQAQAAKGIRHNNIAEFYDYGNEHGFLYAASEFIPGKTLASLIESQGRLDIQIALSLLITIGKALAHLHESGIVHGGVNPGNIRMTKVGEIKLVDAGLAKKLVLRPQGPQEKSAVTPVYLAPELVARPTRIDPRADIYSLGITAFEALTGEKPFLGKTQHETVLRIMNEPLPPETMRHVPQEVAELVSSMVSKYPAERPPDMKTVLAKMESLAARFAPVVVGAAPSESTRQAMDKRKTRSRKKLYIYISIALIVGIIFLLFLLPGRRSTTDDTGTSMTAQEQSQKALEEAKKYETTMPDDTRGAIERYRSVIKTFPETSAAGEAIAAERRLLFRMTEENAGRLAATNNLYEAALVYEAFAKHYAPAREASRASDEKSRLLALIDEKFNNQMLEAARFTQQKKFDEAAALLEGIEKYGTPSHREKAQREIDRIKSSVGVVELEGPYAAAWQAAEPMLAITTRQIAKHEYEAALESCGNFLSSPLPEGVSKIIEWEKEDIAKLIRIRENFSDILGDAVSRGETSSFRLADGTVISGKVTKENDSYYLNISETAKWRIRVEDLLPGDVLKLSGMDGDEISSILASSIYHLYHGEAGIARLTLKPISTQTGRETAVRYANKIELVSAIKSLDMSRLHGKVDTRDLKRATEIVEGARKLVKQSQWDQAYQLLKEAGRLNPGEAETWSLLGKCAAGKGLVSEAIGYYRKALVFNTKNSILWKELGKLYLGQGELGLALAAFAQVARINPTDPVAAQGRIEALLRLGQDEKAKQVREEWEKARRK